MGRTRLTTAPGGALTVDDVRRDDEHWTPGLALPVEPTWPGRLRRVWVAVLVAVVLVVLAVVFVQLNERGNSFDPSLDPSRFSDDGSTSDE